VANIAASRAWCVVQGPVSGGGVVDEASTGDTRGSDREAEVWHLGSAEARPPQPFLVALVK
jgi:hypothetical protein